MTTGLQLLIDSVYRSLLQAESSMESCSRSPGTAATKIVTASSTSIVPSNLSLYVYRNYIPWVSPLAVSADWLYFLLNTLHFRSASFEFFQGYGVKSNLPLELLPAGKVHCFCSGSLLDVSQRLTVVDESNSGMAS